MLRPAWNRVYVACSLDGFMAGPDNDLTWLPGSQGETGESKPEPPHGADQGGLGFDAFIADVGALLMGRQTYDVVAGFGGAWPYGDLPVLVATRGDLNPVHPTVRAVAGDIGVLVDRAREAARGKDVYLDGGTVIRQALDAGLVDDLVVTMVPIVLGAGIPLFAGATQRHALQFVGHHGFEGGLVQLHARPAAGSSTTP
ncbi:MAG: dihydrofolate reductase family protein [Deltaproteobacteria bacterium]|nr:dihydrofolate reductase family protein [Deltaproteobacteria bacterium]